MLAAVDDALRRWPDLIVDWVVDERFADIPRLDSRVRHVFAVPLRAWRKPKHLRRTLIQAFTLIRRLRATHYDVVVDGQGMWKSVLLSLLTKHSRRVGHAPEDCGEPIVAYAYNKRCPALPSHHGAARLRRLMAFAVGSNPNGPLCFGINKPSATAHVRYAVLQPNASKAEKHWPNDHWAGLGHALIERNLQVLLPSGNEQERAAMKELTERIGPGATLAPAQSIAAWVSTLGAAELVVSTDTGLGHIAAALGTPTVMIFISTRPDFFCTAQPRISRAVVAVDGVVEPQSVLTAALAVMQAAHENRYERAV